jgi:hypothetical protein
MINEDVCAEIYFKFHDMPGWLNLIRETGCSEEALDYIVALDESYRKVWKDVDSLKNEMQFEYEIGLLACDGEDEEINLLSKLIAEAYKDYNESMLADEPAINRMLMLKTRQVKRMEKLRRVSRGKQVHDASYRGLATEYKGFIPEEEIERARNYPMESLVGEMRNNRIQCPFHQGEDRNMVVKDGWVYCFVCHESADTIKWVMTQEGLSFVDAVKRLQ